MSDDTTVRNNTIIRRVGAFIHRHPIITKTADRAAMVAVGVGIGVLIMLITNPLVTVEGQVVAETDNGFVLTSVVLNADQLGIRVGQYVVIRGLVISWSTKENFAFPIYPLENLFVVRGVI